MSISDGEIDNYLRSVDLDAVKEQYRTAQPFPFFVIDGFLKDDFARAVLNAYPSYDEARRIGHEFEALNEKFKVQITDSAQFPNAVKQLSDVLASAEFLKRVEHITGIPKLLADAELNGGGMHLTGPTGRLDVHVDFNVLHEKLHRRLNILVYLNPVWEEAWGGNIELWDREVKNCMHSMQPVFNRCVVFETSDISYHGVTPIKCPPGQVRRSFAAYYYTNEAPAHWTGTAHSTLFRARPTEKLRGSVLMPAQKLRDDFRSGVRKVKDIIKKNI
jgi:hypothetical protein